MLKSINEISQNYEHHFQAMQTNSSNREKERIKEIEERQSKSA